MDLVGLLRPEYVAEGRRIHEGCLKTYRLLQGRLGVEQLRPPLTNLYDAYPFLFAPLFPGLDPERLRELATAMHYYRVACLASDAAFDGQETDRWNHLWVPYVYGESMRHLAGLFGTDHEYWQWFERFHVEWLDALRLEATAADTPLAERLAFDRFAVIARGKSALAKNPAVAVALLGGDLSVVPPLLESHDLLAIGFQLYDDLTDWREDARSGRLSYVLDRILADGELEWSGPADEEQLEQMGRRLYQSGLYRELLDLSLDHLDRSLFALQGLKLPDWEAFNRLLHYRVVRLYSDVLKARHPPYLIKLGQPDEGAATPRLAACADRALRLLVAQQAVGFPTASHNMPVPPELGRKGSEPVIRASLRQRALIAQALTEAAALGLPLDRQVLDQERAFLINSRTTDHGWSYYSGLPGIPANADDLGHLLPVLLDSPEGVEALAPALAAVEMRQRDLPTFLVGGTQDLQGAKLSLQLLQLLGGEGPDPEVKANLLAGLAQIPGERFSEAIRSGTLLVERMQRPDGSWSSRWYLDSVYPVYACVRLLSRVGPAGQALEKAEEWLRGRQQSDGGWGNPQATALAVLALGMLPPERPGRRQALEAGVGYLLGTQRPDGSWCGSPFLSPGLRQPAQATAIPIYQSAILTTAFALRALLTQFEPRRG